MVRRPTYEELEQKVEKLEKEAGNLKVEKDKLSTFQFMIESAHDAIFFKDIESRYIIANNKTLEAFGLSKEDVIGKSDYELMPNQNEAKKNVDDDQIVFKTAMLTDVTKHMTGANGKEHWFQAIKVPRFDNDGKVIGLVGIARDISKQKQAEEALRESEEKYSRLFHRSNDAIFIHDLDGNIIDVNQKALELFGYTKSEISSIQIFMLHPVETLEKSKWALAKIIREGVVEFETEFKKKNDGTFFAEVSASIFEIGGKRVIQGIVRDITERKRIERELRKVNDELEYRVKERTVELEIKTIGLEEINTAMKVLLEKREEDKKNIENNILTNISKLISPYIDKIRKTELDSHQKAFLEIIESNLEEITSQFTRKISLGELNLTPSEIQIANMIRHGNSSKEIARIMNISVRTVDTHRRNIRKKIGLNQKRANLRSHLLSLH